MNNSFISPTLHRILLEALILCVLAAAIGLTLNFQMVFNAFSGKATTGSTTLNVPAGEVKKNSTEVYQLFPTPVELPEIDALLADGAILVDARSPESYRAAHLAGALSLPFAGLEEYLADFKKQVPSNSILLLYCSGYGCPDSFDLGVRLLKEGYTEVMVYEGGFPEWRDAGKPLEEVAQ